MANRSALIYQHAAYDHTDHSHTLRIGFAFGEYPYYYKTQKGEPRGIYYDLWEQVAKETGQQLEVTVETGLFGSYARDPETGRFGGLLDMIEDDKLDVACGDYQCTEGRLEGFYCTLPFDYRKYQIFEEVRHTNAASIWKRMQHFLLSTPEWTAVFCLLILILGFLEVCSCGRPKGARTWTLFVLTTAAGLSHLLAGTTYSSLFTDRAVYKEPTKPKTLNTMVNDLRRGHGTLILESKQEFKEEEVRDFFGTDTPSDSVFKGIDDVQSIVDLLCANPNTAFFDFNFKLAFQFSRTLLNIHCDLEPISNIDYALIPPESSIHFLEVGSESPKVHMFSRRLPKSITERVNYLVLGMYSYEKFSSFWFRRHTGRNQYADVSAASVFTIPQVSYSRVQILVEVFGVAYAAIFGIFIGEIVIDFFIRRIVPSWKFGQRVLAVVSRRWRWRRDSSVVDDDSGPVHEPKGKST